MEKPDIKLLIDNENEWKEQMLYGFLVPKYVGRFGIRSLDFKPSGSISFNYTYIMAISANQVDKWVKVLLQRDANPIPVKFLIAEPGENGKWDYD